MISRARRIIERWHVPGKNGVLPKREPFYVAPGHVVIFPSKSGSSTHHVTCRVERRTAKHVYVEWICSCKGWFNSSKDECWHVIELKKQYEQGLAKLEEKGTA